MTPTLEQIAEAVKLRRKILLDTKAAHLHGHATYDELALAAKAYGEALYYFAQQKNPQKARRIPYQNLIRNAR